MSELKRPTLSLPNNASKLLLHSCCAPCSGEVMEAITASGIDYTIPQHPPAKGAFLALTCERLSRDELKRALDNVGSM